LSLFFLTVFPNKFLVKKGSVFLSYFVKNFEKKSTKKFLKFLEKLSLF
jgi:hypothetical protein